MTKLVTFGLLCAAALVVAAYARDDRRCVFIAALVVSANWLMFSMPWIYNAASIAHILVSRGFQARHEDAWSVVDLVSLVFVIITCRKTWWAPLLWSPYLVTLSMLAVAWANDLQYTEYSAVLDAALVVQLATLFAVGGAGGAERVFSFCASLCGVRGGASKLAKTSGQVARISEPTP